MSAPNILGLSSTVTFGENTVNSTPQLLNSSVTFTDADGDFDTGTLTVTGLLAEDTISVRSQGSDIGQIALDGTDVTFGGVVIGTLAGGDGAALTITFNAQATSDAVDALIENLTYANSSDTPTASRALILNVTDAAGEVLNPNPAITSFATWTGTNPFDGIDIGTHSAPVFVDLDGDLDKDMVIGTGAGTLIAYLNDGSDLAPNFTAWTGTDPFDGIDVGDNAKPAFVQLDSDSDLEMVVGKADGTLVSYDYDSGTSAYVAWTGTDPFDGISVAGSTEVGNEADPNAAPVFMDLDSDGDADAVVGNGDGTISLLRNEIATTGNFVAWTDADPFTAVDVGTRTTPAFADLDADGDLDLVVGSGDGVFEVYMNGTTGTSGDYAAWDGVSPMADVNLGSGFADSIVSLIDLDGDGQLDIVVGSADGTLIAYKGTTSIGQVLTVAVTAQNDAPDATGLPLNVVTDEDAATELDLTAISLTDADNPTDDLTLTFTASAGVFDLSDDRLAAFVGAIVADGDDTDTVTLTGTALALSDFLQDNSIANPLSYLGAQNVFGEDVATITVSVDDGSGAVQLGLINVDINDILDVQTGTNSAESISGTTGADATDAVGGNDTVLGSAGADDLDGGDGVDMLNYATSLAAVSVDLATTDVSGGDAEGDTIANFENVIGSDFDDVLTGDGTGNRLVGGAGDDTLVGAGDRDTIAGGDGADNLDGGTGLDTLSYFNSLAAVSVNLATGAVSGGDAEGDTVAGFERVLGSGFADSLTGNAHSNKLVGGAGDDTLSGGRGADELTGGTGEDHFVFDAARGPANLDTVTDFSVADDMIELDQSFFAALASGGLDASAFLASANGRALTTDQHILYETDTGKLYYDSDGRGGVSRIVFATLDIDLAMTADSFWV